jgi:adenylosuccinate synthase
LTPIYETLPGWRTDVSRVTSWEELPAGAHRFLERVIQLVGCPIEVVSVGPARDQTIFADDVVRA